jgi:hypothetical protein
VGTRTSNSVLTGYMSVFGLSSHGHPPSNNFNSSYIYIYIYLFIYMFSGAVFEPLVF